VGEETAEVTGAEPGDVDTTCTGTAATDSVGAGTDTDTAISASMSLDPAAAGAELAGTGAEAGELVGHWPK